MTYEAAPEPVFHHGHHSSPVSIIPPVVHVHLFTIHQRYITSEMDGVVK
jgi:hypothetical protein